MFAMSVKFEQQACITCVKLGKLLTETFEMLHVAFKEQSLRWTKVFEWPAHFKASRMSLDEGHSGGPSTSKPHKNVEKFVNSSMKTINKQSMTCVGIGYRTCQEILTENIRFVSSCCKIFPLALVIGSKAAACWCVPWASGNFEPLMILLSSLGL